MFNKIKNKVSVKYLLLRKKQVRIIINTLNFEITNARNLDKKERLEKDLKEFNDIYNSISSTIRFLKSNTA